MLNGTSVKPFLKWAGGKAQLLHELAKLCPNKVRKYYEPFLGGGALFFFLGPKNYLLSDNNPELINLYKCVADHPREIVRNLETMKNEESYFYNIRNKSFFELDKIYAAARTIYLNRTCFNGLYRVNKKGHFNVPYGKYKNPNIVQKEKILLASRLLSSRKIKLMDFREIEKIKFSKDDFIFFDPPYVPAEGYADFKRYTQKQFNYDDHFDLAEIFTKLATNKLRLILTNSDTHFVRTLYKKHKIITVESKRLINIKSDKRKSRDVIIYANI